MYVPEMKLLTLLNGGLVEIGLGSMVFFNAAGKGLSESGAIDLWLTGQDKMLAEYRHAAGYVQEIFHPYVRGVSLRR